MNSIFNKKVINKKYRIKLDCLIITLILFVSFSCSEELNMYENKLQGNFRRCWSYDQQQYELLINLVGNNTNKGVNKVIVNKVIKIRLQL